MVGRGWGIKGGGELGFAAELPKEATAPGIPGNSEVLVQSWPYEVLL